MALDVKQIMIDQFTRLFENFIWLILIAFVVALYFFLFRHEVAEEFLLTHREKNKLTEKSLIAIIFVIGATIEYLYIKEYYLVLSVIFSVTLTYFLYLTGILDMLINKLESR